MNRGNNLIKGLIVSGLILGAALLIADCLECRSASRASVVAACAVVMALMIGLQFRYLFGRFSRSIGATAECEESKRGDQQEHQREMRVSKLTVPSTVINVVILALAGIWMVGATSSLYPPVIPLMFFVVGVATVLLFGAAAGMSARVRAALAQTEAPSPWRWIALSTALATLIVIAVVMYGLDVLREYPLVGLVCAALGLVITSCGVYRSGVTEEDKSRQASAESDR